MKLRRTLFTAIIAVAAVTLAATVSASPIKNGPSFNKIAYFNYDARDKGFDVMLVNTDGTSKLNITHDGTAVQNVDPNWSPNGTKIAFARYNLVGGADIFVLNATGKGLVKVSGPSVSERIVNTHPTWARDGSIVFASNRDGNFDLYRVGAAATDGIVRMTKTDAPIQNMYPDYSIDGKMLVFSRSSALSATPATASLFTMQAIPGAAAMKLTKAITGLGDRAAAWSPDNRQIAFYSDRAGNNDIYVINRDGSSLTRLTSSTASELEPTWSPDGHALAYLSDRTGHTELWLMNVIGANLGDPPTWPLMLDKLQKGAPDWQPATPVPGPAPIN